MTIFESYTKLNVISGAELFLIFQKPVTIWKIKSFTQSEMNFQQIIPSSKQFSRRYIMWFYELFGLSLFCDCLFVDFCLQTYYNKHFAKGNTSRGRSRQNLHNIELTFQTRQIVFPSYFLFFLLLGLAQLAAAAFWGFLKILWTTRRCKCRDSHVE